MQSDQLAGARAEAAYYREWTPRAELRRHLVCVWAVRSADADPLLPDGAVGLVWSGTGLFVRGTDTRPHAIGSFPERTFVAARFRPGAAARVLGLHGADLADARAGVSELWGRAEMERLESQLGACASPDEAAALLEDVVAARVREPPDPLVEAVVAALQARPERLRVSTLAAHLGFSERQLLRRCTDALGYGPTTLARILRFQRFRSLAARRPDLGLAELAACVGYADQPHLTRECVGLGGETPAALVGRRRG